MGKRWMILGVVAVVVVAGLAINLAVAQERAGGRRMDPEQLRQRYMERVQEALSPTDEEWAALEGPVGTVVSLSMEPGVSGGMRLGGRRGGGEAATGQSAVAVAAAELQTAVDAGAEDVAAKLAAYRDAREEARADLAAAREAIKGMINPTQEAKLVLAGVLE